MVDFQAAAGYVVAHGDDVDRARLSWLRSGLAPPDAVLDKAEAGQAARGGWPALWDSRVPSVDATCFRLAELDDLGALGRPAAQRALDWLAGRQREDGTWEEDPSLAGLAPSWARPGDPEARLYLTASAGFWLAACGPSPGGPEVGDAPPGGYRHAPAVARAARAFLGALAPDGAWSSYLATGWLGGALLYHLRRYYESAQIQAILAERVPQLAPSDVASLAAAMRRVGLPRDEWLLVAARRRLSETQRTDGGWDGDAGPAFDVHTTLTAIRGAS